MYDIETRTLEPHPTLVMHGIMPVNEIPDFLGKAYAAVAQHAGTIHSGFAGPPFARYHPLDEAFTKFEVEAGFPTHLAVAGGGSVVASELPGGPAAVTVHVGPYDAMKPAYEVIQAWFAEHGFTPASPAWEVYLSDPNEHPDPATWRTEIVWPYR